MTGAIILAAGSSSRMGRSKQLLDINGEKLLTRTVRTVLQSETLDTVLVVLGSEEKSHKALLGSLPVETVCNTNWRLGMGSSIKTGLNHLLSNHPRTDTLVIFVCDQPLLSSAHVSEMIATHFQTRKPIVASEYGGEAGVPVLFAASCFGKLQSLPDEQGAKRVILQNSSDVALVPFPCGEIDLDTMDDYEKYLKGESTSFAGRETRRR